MTYCKECLSKQQRISNLEEEIITLKSKLHYQERTGKEGFFGSSTSSAKIPVKPNRQKKRAPDVTTAFKSALDKMAEQANIDPNKAVFGFDSS